MSSSVGRERAYEGWVCEAALAWLEAMLRRQTRPRWGGRTPMVGSLVVSLPWSIVALRPGFPLRSVVPRWVGTGISWGFCMCSRRLVAIVLGDDEAILESFA